MIDKAYATQIAAGWHSVSTWADEGVCMYALSSTGRIQSPEHRVKLIDYIKSNCLDVVAPREKHTANEDDGMEDPNRVDREELESLLEYVENAPLEPE